MTTEEIRDNLMQLEFNKPDAVEKAVLQCIHICNNLRELEARVAAAEQQALRAWRTAPRMEGYD